MVLAYVPAGVFEMGASEDDTAALRDERPQHSVNLGAFWIDQTEVTNGQYALCVEDGECRIPYSATSYTRNPYYGVSEYVDFPVVFVTWNDARDYCQWAGRRLPTEAEWEKAARGQEDRLYPWGAELDCDLANFRDCLGDTAEAISFPGGASTYGVLNMAGNVWEWVADWYYFAYYDFAPFENPTGPPSGAYRVIRGGSFNDDPIYLRTSSRYWYYPDNARFSVGFRCAISEYP
jgi:formylglycine-generating enzyme required for sulfatase activity